MTSKSYPHARDFNRWYLAMLHFHKDELPKTSIFRFSVALGAPVVVASHADHPHLAALSLQDAIIGVMLAPAVQLSEGQVPPS
jgi:hypothetical protein